MTFAFISKAKEPEPTESQFKQYLEDALDNKKINKRDESDTSEVL